MNYLSMCAVLRNEAPYIKEWVDFYLGQGVEHFYLYDNESNDKPEDVLKDYKCITWHKTKGFKQQRVAYNHTIANYRNETSWCCFFDLDEFCYSTKNDRFADTLRCDYDRETISGLAIHWLLFGSNYETEYRDEPVTKRFTMRADSVNDHVKSIMRMSDVQTMGNDPHTFRSSGMIVDENLNVMPIEYAIMPGGSANVMRLNHYYTKSKGEHMKRKALPDANSGVIKDALEQFIAHDRNEIHDTGIWEVL